MTARRPGEGWLDNVVYILVLALGQHLIEAQPFSENVRPLPILNTSFTSEN